MKTFGLWLSVNDGEYYTKIKVRADECVIGVPRYNEEEMEMEYPVYVDEHLMLFQEEVSFVEDDD